MRVETHFSYVQQAINGLNGARKMENRNFFWLTKFIIRLSGFSGEYKIYEPDFGNYNLTVYYSILWPACKFDRTYS